MYRITKQDMENEINALKRSPSDRQNRRPPLLHDPLTRPNRNGLSLGLNNNHHSDSIGTICLRLRNIPYSTSEQQIYDFFANDSMPIENCKILRDRFNRGAGEALVRFSDPQTCQMAYERKNRQIFHGRSLDLRLISTIEYQNCPLTLSNVSGNETSFHQGNNKRTAHFHDRNDNDRSRDKRARWDGNGNFHRNSNRSSKDQNDGKVSEETKNSSTNSATNNFPPLPSEMNEHAGRILVLSNVAYRATREEILEFLRSYSPIPDTLKIRCDANGRPTGFGVVACGTADDAARAVEELHNQMFMARQISLQHR